MLPAALFAASMSSWVVPPAAAHARLVESVPAEGAVLATPPATLVFRFDGAVEPALTRVVLHGPTDVVLPPLRGDDPRRVVVTAPTGRPGDWWVTWRVVSRDGHPVTGELRFVVR
ncbi:MAG: copper resistance CopC family protein [Myxococcota bacterium]